MEKTEAEAEVRVLSVEALGRRAFMADVAELMTFLRDEARINHRVIGKVVQSLEVLEVWEVDDLVHLERLPVFEECLSAVAASKVRS